MINDIQMNSTNVLGMIPYKISLLTIYVVLLIYVVVQLVLVLISRNKKRSFHMQFLILSFLWTAFRVAASTRMLIPGKDTTVEALVWQTQEWLTIQIQWSMFTFLLLYYFRLLSEHEWSDRYRRKGVIVYTVANCVSVFVVLTIAAVNAYGSYHPTDAVKDSHNRTQDLSSWCSSAFDVYTSLMFVSLIVGMIVFSVKLLQKNRVRKYRLLNVAQTVAVNMILSLVFLSRALFDMYNALAKFYTTQLEIDYPANGLHKDYSGYVALLLVTWEALPMFLLLITLAKNKAVEKRLFSKGNLQPGYGVFCQLEHRASMDSDVASVDSMDALLLQYDSPELSEGGYGEDY